MRTWDFIYWDWESNLAYELKLLHFGLCDLAYLFWLMYIIKMFGLSYFGLSSIINTHLAYVLRLAYVESLIGLCRNWLMYRYKKEDWINSPFCFIKLYIIFSKLYIVFTKLYIILIHQMLLINLIILIFSFSIHLMLSIKTFKNWILKW